MKTLLLYLMAGLYIMAGINHFWHPETYLLIMPPFLPNHRFFNGASGISEIILGALLLFKKTRQFSVWGITVLLILFFTVHIYMLLQALDNNDYVVSPIRALARLLLQPVLIAWVLWYRKVS